MEVFVTRSIFSENKSKLFYGDVPVSLFALKTVKVNIRRKQFKHGVYNLALHVHQASFTNIIASHLFLTKTI